MSGMSYPHATTEPTATQRRVADRFGVLPNFFKLAPDAPPMAEALFEFAKFAYLDSPLPSLFKERLFVHLSRFCEVRYCLVRHFCFLIGRGRPSGDANVAPMTADVAIALLKRSFTPQRQTDRLVEYLRGVHAAEDIEPDSELETALFAVCTAIFLNPAKARPYLQVLRRVLGGERYEYLLAFIGFIRMAHYWTQVHPELSEEEDVQELMHLLERLAWGLAWDTQAGWSVIADEVGDELRQLKAFSAPLERL
jgi:hypothetical protein